MERKFSIVCVTLSVLCLLAAVGWRLNNLREAEQARQNSEEVMIVFEQILEEASEAVAEPLPAQSETAAVYEAPEPETALNEPNMPEVEINGNNYIGYLNIPVLKLELPVMSDWNYQKLEISPCRYQGSVQDENLVLTAHNYPHHFGGIQLLQPGDTVEFVDMDKVSTAYEVAATGTIMPTEIGEVTSGIYDLTLFTCTYGGQQRVVVHCNMMK